MKSHTLVRLFPWILLIAAAYAVGHWRGRESAGLVPPVGPAEVPATAATNPPTDLLVELAAIAEAARYMPEPDARTHAFFETLAAADLDQVTTWIEQMPTGNEQDALSVMVMRRWGELDAVAALARADTFANLNTRVAARSSVYESWGQRDAEAAFAHAQADKNDESQMRAFAALLVGAAIKYPGGAVTLWEGTSAEFRNTDAGNMTLERIVDAAYGTGQRAAIEAIVAGLPLGEVRLRLAVALARNWAPHQPQEALTWLATAIPEGPALRAAGDVAFDAYARRSPEAAAEWALRKADEDRRSGYLASAIVAWTPLDARSAEIWLNEQEDGPYLDGASYAMSAHFMERRNLTRAFAWIRRITRNEARAEMLASLGEIWNAERPEEFKKFLGETSLNRTELEMLLSRIEKTPSA